MRFFLFLFLTCALIGAALVILGVAPSPGKEDAHRLRIVCTTGMIADVVQRLVGDTAEVQVLMGPGIDPHLYRATESNIHAIAAAQLVIYNGLHLEGKMSDLFTHLAAAKRVVCVADALAAEDIRIVEESGCIDPHIWHDVYLWKKVVLLLLETVCSLNESLAPLYQERAVQYIQELEELDAWVFTMIERIPCTQRILITAHDAFGYLGKRYGLQVVGLQGVSTEADIGTRDVSLLADLIVEKRIPALFVESSVPERSIKAVQEAVSARGNRVLLGAELFSDALGDKAVGAHTYEGMIRYNIRALVSSLQNEILS